MEETQETPRTRLYLDQNIVQYAYEDKIRIDLNNSVDYIFSNVHFDEIDRKVDTRFFAVLNRLMARHISIVLDEKFKITENAKISLFEETEQLYHRYLVTVGPYRQHTEFFLNLRPFFMGNAESLDPGEAGATLKNLLMQPFRGLDTTVIPKELTQKYEELVGLFALGFSATLETAKNQVRPIEDARKKFTKERLSEINPKDGPIIDQIWEQIRPAFGQFTKDQIFGKEALPTSPEKEMQPFLSVVQCHTMLNTLGYWPDEGLKKVNKSTGIQCDAAHIANALYCDGIVSADDRLCKKAYAIYQYLGAKTSVIQVKFVGTKDE